jgi:hypothetical protein
LLLNNPERYGEGVEIVEIRESYVDTVKYPYRYLVCQSNTTLNSTINVIQTEPHQLTSCRVYLPYSLSMVSLAPDI